MRPNTQALIGLLRGGTEVDRVLPPPGRTTGLVTVATAAMAFFAVVALALTLAAGRYAAEWDADLARSATVQLPPASEGGAAQVATALRMLEAAPGVARADALDAAEQAELLAPWFGRDLPVDLLPVPRLIAVTATSAGIDAQELQQRLDEAVPGAVLDDHSDWRQPQAGAALRLSLLGWLSLALIAATIAAVVMVAALGLLSASGQVITVLRMVGAPDGRIAQAFERRMTAQGLAGAALGTVLGCLAVLALPGARIEAGLLSGLGFRGWHWLWPLVIPPLAGGLSYIVTRVIVRRQLGELP